MIWWVAISLSSLLPQNIDAQAIDYGPMQIAGAIADPDINESSGLAASRANPGMLWTHNDSGDSARLFLLSERGVLRAQYRVDLPFATDWEDMCSFEMDGKPWLLVGDTGDNAHRRASLTLWLIPEPTFDADRPSAFPLRLKPARRIDVKFADGPRDCEAVAFDAVRQEIVLVTKVDPRRPPVGQAGVYVLPLAPGNTRAGDRAGVGGGGVGGTSSGGGKVVMLDRIADLDLRVTVAADISPDGSRCVVATYGDAWQYVRGADETWAQAFGRPGVQVALGPRGQSEAMAFAGDGVTLVLSAEGVGKPLWAVSPGER